MNVQFPENELQYLDREYFVQEVTSELERLAMMKGYNLVNTPNAPTVVNIELATLCDGVKNRIYFRRATAWVKGQDEYHPVSGSAGYLFTLGGVKEMTFKAMRKLVKKLPECY